MKNVPLKDKVLSYDDLQEHLDTCNDGDCKFCFNVENSIFVGADVLASVLWLRARIRRQMTYRGKEDRFGYEECLLFLNEAFEDVVRE